jgi:hypothetical protein
MADIHDFLAASRETDNALSTLQTLGSQIEDHERSGDLGTLLAGIAIANAIREVGCRLDYVLREIANRDRPTQRF